MILKNLKPNLFVKNCVLVTKLSTSGK